MEAIKKLDYDKMKENAGEFAKMLIKFEQDFKQQLTNCGDGLAIYFDIQARNDKTITVFFKDNGYVGFEVGEDE
jgi:hypothetical protein